MVGCERGQRGAVAICVATWRRRLKARALGHRFARLSEAEWRVLGRILGGGAVAAGVDTEEWRLKRIVHVIEREFDATYHYRHLERPLKPHGFSAPSAYDDLRAEPVSKTSGWSLSGCYTLGQL